MDADEETTTRSGGRPDLDGEADDPWSRKEAARTPKTPGSERGRSKEDGIRSTATP
jgi:hypothetical protein